MRSEADLLHTSFVQRREGGYITLYCGSGACASNWSCYWRVSVSNKEMEMGILVDDYHCTLDRLEL